VSQGLVPIIDRYETGFVVVFSLEVELTEFHKDLREIFIFSQFPTF
jgi:hypothetical protein